MAETRYRCECFQSGEWAEATAGVHNRHPDGIKGAARDRTEIQSAPHSAPFFLSALFLIMPHECRVWLRNGICDICQASLGVVNVLRHLRKWEQVIDGAFTKDQIAFDLERLCNDHEVRPSFVRVHEYLLILARVAQSRRERDHSLLDSQMVIVFLDGRQVTLNTIPSYTRAGLLTSFVCQSL
ncbi:hypothetical protein BKA62DRAFT_700481 [Auriculariales sp. MPI-PUGE-AT-0066]|nr:hypothetical protein BKA62DRAFT_700481 [Auriculariales sp. MPI-PUGE-AT-0066]